ncbi:MAG: PilM [Noviherbaspirillum sp.]|jgi:hypothetical protein|nr:PilM [Noviherbaspirillum sp.]
MWHFLVLVVIVAASGVYVLETEQRISNTVPQEDALAINMLVYRAAVRTYLINDTAFSGPPFSGSTVASNNVQFPPGYIPHPAWDNFVEPGSRRLTVYAKTALPIKITDGLGRVALYSQNAGEARNGRLYVPAVYEQGKNNPPGPMLPPALSGLPDGTPVWSENY